MDKSSLHGANAPHFVNGELVDPLDAQPTVPVAHPTQGQAAAALNKAHPHGVYSLVGAGAVCPAVLCSCWCAVGLLECAGQFLL